MSVSETTAKSLLRGNKRRNLALGTIGVILLVWIVLMIYWSRTPDVFWVNQYVEDNRTVVGYSTTDTLVRVAETLLDKPGGYLSNDRMPPSVFLDNMPNWELGVLQQVRDLSRVMRNDYSRSRRRTRISRKPSRISSSTTTRGSCPAPSPATAKR